MARSTLPTERLESDLPRATAAAISSATHSASFRELMSRSSIAVLTPNKEAALALFSAPEVGSRELVHAMVRILVKRGIISEKELLESLIETRTAHASELSMILLIVVL